MICEIQLLLQSISEMMICAWMFINRNHGIKSITVRAM